MFFKHGNSLYAAFALLELAVAKTLCLATFLTTFQIFNTKIHVGVCVCLLC